MVDIRALFPLRLFSMSLYYTSTAITDPFFKNGSPIMEQREEGTGVTHFLPASGRASDLKDVHLSPSERIPFFSQMSAAEASYCYFLCKNLVQVQWCAT